MFMDSFAIDKMRSFIWWFFFIIDFLFFFFCRLSKNTLPPVAKYDLQYRQHRSKATTTTTTPKKLIDEYRISAKLDTEKHYIDVVVGVFSFYSYFSLFYPPFCALFVSFFRAEFCCFFFVYWDLVDFDNVFFLFFFLNHLLAIIANFQVQKNVSCKCKT